MNNNQPVALITGAGSPNGIGSQVARTFAKEGYTVYIGDVNISSANKVVDEINNDGFDAFSIKFDVSSIEEVHQAINYIVSKHEKIDVLVNNAGVTRPTKILDITENEFDFIFNINMKGTFLVTQAVLPIMIKHNFGRIINLGSVSAKRGGGVFGGSHYSSAKAAVMGFTKAIAREVAPHGITVNSVAPGIIDTGITGDLLDNKHMKNQILSAIPVGRIGKAEDVAEAILFLASTKSGYITGEEIDINGGSHID